MKMPHSPINKFRVALPWLIAWGIIYAIIIFAGIFAQESFFLGAVKVASIFLCFVYATVYFPRDRLLILALFLTCLADLFLAFNNTSIPGLIIFVLAQLVHLVRFDWARYSEAIILFSAAAIIMITLALIFRFAEPIYVVCSFYAVTLTLNLIASLRWRNDDPKNLHAKLAFYGFALFASCDICTGISFLSKIYLLPAHLYTPANFFVWFFYYPAQILISNSAKCATIEPKEGKR